MTTVLADIFAQLGQIGTLVVASLGIFVALRNQHRQLNAQMFIEFSGRFQELLRLFPTEAWLANRQSFSTPPPFEPRIDRLHFVHHPVHSRHLLPSQGRIHLETSVDALGA